MPKSVRLNFESSENLLDDSQADKTMEEEEEEEDDDEDETEDINDTPSKMSLAGPSGKRKSNFSNAEIKFLVNQYKEHKSNLDGLVEPTGNRLEKCEAWEQIHKKYEERWPNKGRSIKDLRRKLSKLRSETKHIYKKEKLKRHGVETSSEVPHYLKDRNIQKSHKIMLSALQSDFEDSDPEAEYVEYELEFDEQEVVGVDDENDGDEGDGPEKIFQKHLSSTHRPKTRSQSKGESEQASKKRKLDSPEKTESEELMNREEEILNLRKGNLEIERKNLLLMQRKLKLEVAILERQLQVTGGSSGSTEGSGSKANSGTSNSTVEGEVVEVIGTDGATESVTIATDE